MKKAFSLIELSIVLVILGLLTGGILAGQSLIRAAELRAVNSEYQRYTTAVQTFRDKYFALPGDFRDATKFWLRQSTGTDCVSNSGLSAAGTPGTCDGDGSGTIGPGPAVSKSAEVMQFWRQLALAGLIEGSYTGIAGPAGTGYQAVRGENSPPSKFSNGTWGSVSWGNQSGDSALFNGTYSNTFILGLANGTIEPAGALLEPEEAWNIDTKIDDGLPAIGNVVVRVRSSCALSSTGTALTSSAADAAKLDSVYNLASTSAWCAPIFRKIY